MRVRHGPAMLATAAAVLSSGCFVAFPLDSTPQVDLDGTLLGTWRCLPLNSAPTEDAATFVVAPLRTRVYALSFGLKDDKPERYELFASLLKGKPVLNVKALDPRSPETAWTFARYSFLRPDVVHVQLLNEDRLKNVEASSASLRHAMEKLARTADLFVDYCVCVRATSEAPPSLK